MITDTSMQYVFFPLLNLLFGGINFFLSFASQNNITPRFEFGFGLSYTNFSYSGLSIQAINDTWDDPADAASVLAWENGDATPIAEGSSRAFWFVILI